MKAIGAEDRLSTDFLFEAAVIGLTGRIIGCWRRGVSTGWRTGQLTDLSRSRGRIVRRFLVAALLWMGAILSPYRFQFWQRLYPAAWAARIDPVRR